MKCDICAIGCQLNEERPGICGKYALADGQIAELYPDRYLIICPISIETMPMLHFYPGGKFLQISTTGCNLDCPGCVSTVLVKEMDHDSAALQHLSPEQVLAEAINNGCLGITFLMNDPLASFHTFLRVARCAREHNLLVGCSSNGYFSAESLAQIMPWLDFVNIGIKGLDDDAYRRCGAPSAGPVLRNLRQLWEYGIHVEVSCMFARDSGAEILKLARSLAEISRDIPLQIMRYIPLEKAAPGMEASIRESESVYHELRDILNHVYLFNSPGTDGLDSFCPGCGKMLYRRDFYGPMGAKIRTPFNEQPVDNICPGCGTFLNMRGMAQRQSYQEGAFLGGYPFTRALEMLEAMLLVMGIDDHRKAVAVWEDVLVNNRLEALHHDVQRLSSNLDTLMHCGDIAGCPEKARDVAYYIRSKIYLVQKARIEAGHSPRVYYAMGKPLFGIKGDRMENQLVEAAGGYSVNRELTLNGRPGLRISAGQLNALNPEVIFISAFISSSVEDFYASCREEGVDVAALRNGRVYCHPAPGWDFGSPRWILGLMFISSKLFPETSSFDIMAEAQEFYQRFYGLDFNGSHINRSFGKPDIRWQWARPAGENYRSMHV